MNDIAMKDMSLDALMTAEPTRTVIDEVSKRVWEKQGKHDMYHWILRGVFPDFIAPDITKPENFWPLAAEMMRDNYGEISFDDDKQKFRFDYGMMWDEGTVYHPLEGLAIAFAYLKRKEQKNGG